VKECPRHFTVHSTLDDHALELMGPRLSTTTLVNSDKDYKFNDARWNEILAVNPDASYLIKGDHAISNSGGVYETHVFAVLELPVATTVYLAVSHSMGFGTRVRHSNADDPSYPQQRRSPKLFTARPLARASVTVVTASLNGAN
jgi:hypothetical protein